MSSENMPQSRGDWRLGVEVFTDETEKHFNGAIYLYADAKEAFVDNMKVIAKSLLPFVQANEKSFPAVREQILSGKYWFHVFKHSDMAKRPKDMFEAAAPKLDAEEKTLEQMLSEDNSTVQDLSIASDNDLYFNTEGDPISGIPEKWAVDMGLT